MAVALVGEDHVAALSAAKDGLAKYNEALDKLVPWSEFDATLDIMSRYQQDFSAEAGVLVGSIKTHMLNSRREYHNATRSVFEWCALVVPLLKGYLRIVQTSTNTADAEKKILSKVFTDGIAKMGKAVEQLDECDSLLSKAVGQLVTLQVQLENDFSQQNNTSRPSVATGPVGMAIAVTGAALTEAMVIKKLKEHFNDIRTGFKIMNGRCQTMSSGISTATKALEDDKDMISKLSAKVTESQVWVSIEGIIMEELTTAAQELHDLCEAYKARHGK
ncbi:hypothetical protein SPRG_03140 [Saprolegnia parasitica CBS 223.65]|uniref:Uncharacterized protein n=1 Tax=Saprolegnia parasitica (strain CBS 223.65) TaxID=695850 RepID=A0A067CMJ1_SAPPC|nr:hypothetical protein SPRG_03140 [Saprolegnia parasitica CBS 223.65]KDO31924.1 hypothetical protein SPRG_03140 [Saprolegnia parasitica CBS 223.65]|eukprot:XP_012197123.1 hypothetical protein SPRG_03140 [Saprolegnia parasitica CBS 223.65]